MIAKIFGALRSAVTGGATSGETVPLTLSQNGSLYVQVVGQDSGGDETAFSFAQPDPSITDVDFVDGLKTIGVSYIKDSVTGDLKTISAKQVNSNGTPTGREITTDDYLMTGAMLCHEWNETANNWQAKHHVDLIQAAYSGNLTRVIDTDNKMSIVAALPHRMKTNGEWVPEKENITLAGAAVSVTTANTLILAANPARRFLLLQGRSPWFGGAGIYVNFQGLDASVAANQHVIISSDNTLQFENGNCPTGAIYGCSSSGTQIIGVLEG